MPEIRYYTVTQERQVKVSANSPVDAARIADAVFHDQTIDTAEVPAQLLTPIRDRDLVVREDY